MKIISNKLLLKFICLIVFLVKLTKLLKDPPNPNSLFKYLNLFEPPTDSDHLGKMNSTRPLLSTSLIAISSKKKLNLNEFQENMRYSLYNLSRGESEQIFNFADKDHDDLLSKKDWNSFSNLFILPFEACDTDRNYLLDEAELKICLENDPKMMQVKFKDTYNENKYKVILSIMSTTGGDSLNLSDYLILRRALFGWVTCQTNSELIIETDYSCALRAAVPNKYQLSLDIERIYLAGVNYLDEMDFIAYLGSIQQAYAFSILVIPYDNPWIEEKHFLRAIKEEKFTTHFTEADVKLMFELSQTDPFQSSNDMTYETFCFYFRLQKLFIKYSKTRVQQINFKEFNSILDDSLAPFGLALAIDSSKTNFTDPQYKEVSLALQPMKAKEKEFFYSFKSRNYVAQPAPAQAINDYNNYYDPVPVNPTNRQIFFMTMCGSSKDYWTKEMMFKAFQFSNVFLKMVKGKKWLVTAGYIVKFLPNLYGTVNPPVALKYRKGYTIFKYIGKEIHIDLLTFLIVHSGIDKLSHGDDTIEAINETDLKIMLRDFGMSDLPDAILELGMKGHDSLNRRLYAPKDILKSAVAIQAMTAENIRNKEYFIQYNLNHNSDATINFPPTSKKFMV